MQNHIVSSQNSYSIVLSCFFFTGREHKKRSDSQWLKTVLTSGTLSDKMAALTLQVEESPVHSLSALDSLVAMVHKKGKREAMMAAGIFFFYILAFYTYIMYTTIDIKFIDSGGLGCVH